MSTISGIFIPQDVLDLIILKLYNQTSTLINKRSRDNYFQKYGIHIRIRYHISERKYITYYPESWNNPNKYMIRMKIKGLFVLSELKETLLRLTPSYIRFRQIFIYDYYCLTTLLENVHLKGSVIIQNTPDYFKYLADDCSLLLGKKPDNNPMLDKVLANIQKNTDLLIDLNMELPNNIIIEKPCLSCIYNDENYSNQNELTKKITYWEHPENGELPNAETASFVYIARTDFTKLPKLPKLKKIIIGRNKGNEIIKLLGIYPTVKKITTHDRISFNPSDYQKLKKFGLKYEIKNNQELERIINSEKTNPGYNNGIVIIHETFGLKQIMIAAKYFKVEVCYISGSSAMNLIKQLLKYKGFSRFKKPRKIEIWVDLFGKMARLVSLYQEVVILFREKNIFANFRRSETLLTKFEKMEIYHIKQLFKRIKIGKDRQNRTTLIF